MGEVAWVGRGSLGRDDGRVVLYRPGRELLRPTGPAGRRRAARPTRSTSELRAHLRRRGASFYRELFAASGGRADREVLDALWDLVWAGEVTNDTFAPLRALRWKRPAKDHRPRMGRLTALGPPEATGRWSLAGDRRGRPARRGAGRHPDRAGPRARARAARAPRRRDPRSRRERADRRRLLGRLPGAARDGGGRADPPRLLRRWPGRRAVRAAGCRRPAAGDARPARRARGRARAGRPAARRGRSRQPVRRGARLAAARRDGPAAVPAGGGRLRRAGRRRRGPLPRPRRDVDPDPAGGRRPGGARRRRSRPCATSSPTAGCASS